MTFAEGRERLQAAMEGRLTVVPPPLRMRDAAALEREVGGFVIGPPGQEPRGIEVIEDRGPPGPPPDDLAARRGKMSRRAKDRLIGEALAHMNAGKFDQAAVVYQKILALDPDDIRVRLKLGDLYAKQGKNKEATDFYLAVAEAYAGQGFYLKSVAVYKTLLRLDPRLIEVNLRLAELYRSLGLLSDAMLQYELVAEAYAKENRVRERLAALRQIVELDPENVTNRLKLAEQYATQGLNADALEEFQRAADFLRAKGNQPENLALVLERIWSFEPANPTVAQELARLYLEKGDTDQALEKLQAAFKINPSDETTLILLLRTFRVRKHFAEAIGIIQELLMNHDRPGGHRLHPLMEIAVRYSFHDLNPSDEKNTDRLLECLRLTRGHYEEYLASLSEVGYTKPQAERNARLLSETNTYLRYGLDEKARERITRRAFLIEPQPLPSGFGPPPVNAQIVHEMLIEAESLLVRGLEHRRAILVLIRDALTTGADPVRVFTLAHRCYELDREDPEISILLAQCNESVGDREKALAIYRKLVAVLGKADPRHLLNYVLGRIAALEARAGTKPGDRDDDPHDPA